MATIRLEQRGISLVARSARLVVTVNRPRVKAIYDQCGILDYVKTAGSYSVSGRATCEDRMVDIVRLSYSYLQKAPAITDTAGDLTFAKIRATDNLFKEVAFGDPDAQPGAPVETSLNQSFYVLEDQCQDPIGNNETTSFTRFSFSTDCRLSVLTSITTKLAVNETLGTNVAAIHASLGGLFTDTLKIGGDGDATTTKWLALAGADIVLNIPGMDTVFVNTTAPTP